jgi:DNA topoisomerase-2
MQEYHTDTTVNFRIVLSEEQMVAAEDVGLEKKFKLETSVSLTNMVLFDSAGRLKKYDTVDDILTDFFELRLDHYQKRKDDLADKLTELWSRLDNQVCPPFLSAWV